MGGSEVHLLFGIKNTNLDLFWIKTLPSGVAVYQSVFKDILGSDLIFAGLISHSLMVIGLVMLIMSYLESTLLLAPMKTNRIIGLMREIMQWLLTKNLV